MWGAVASQTPVLLGPGWAGWLAIWRNSWQRRGLRPALASRPRGPCAHRALPCLCRALPRTPCRSFPCRPGTSLSPLNTGQHAQHSPLTLMAELQTGPAFLDPPCHLYSPLPKVGEGPGLAKVWRWRPAGQQHGSQLPRLILCPQALAFPFQGLGPRLHPACTCSCHLHLHPRPDQLQWPP